MAAYQNVNKRLGLNSTGFRETKNGVQVEQKAAHVELLLRRLYAKVDELESVCKEEKEFYAILKRKGRKNIPKYDSQLLPRVVAGQQRCAETAFNNLDLYKYNLLRSSSSRKSTVSLPAKVDKSTRGNDGPSGRGDNHWSSSVINSTTLKPADVSPVQREGGSSMKDASWYGSLDRNMKKKKKGYLDRNRRHTKTVGSLAGLNVENIDMLQPDEQYTFGLPTVEPLRFDSNIPVIETRISEPPFIHGIARNSSNTVFPGLPDRRDVRAVNWQIPRSHSYTRSQPVSVFPGVTSEREPPRWLESSVDTVDSTLGSTEVLPPSLHENKSVDSDPTDFNFNRLAISSPTQASERSSRSSENGDSKGSFMNESTKPFEMSDYYKYSMKYRGQRKEPSTNTMQEAPKLQRINGVTSLRHDVSGSVPHGRIDNGEEKHVYNSDARTNSVSDKTEVPEDAEQLPVPKLPPKLRPLLNSVSAVNNNRISQRNKPNSADFMNGNVADSSQAAWVQTTPTIV